MRSGTREQIPLSFQKRRDGEYHARNDAFAWTLIDSGILQCTAPSWPNDRCRSRFSLDFHFRAFLDVGLLLFDSIVRSGLGLLVIRLSGQFGLIMGARILLGDLSKRHGRIRARSQRQAQLERCELGAENVDLGSREAEQLVLVRLGEGDIGIVIFEVFPGKMLRHMNDLAVRTFQRVFPVKIKNVRSQNCLSLHRRIGSLLVPPHLERVQSVFEHDRLISLEQRAFGVGNIVSRQGDDDIGQGVIGEIGLLEHLDFDARRGLPVPLGVTSVRGWLSWKMSGCSVKATRIEASVWKLLTVLAFLLDRLFLGEHEIPDDRARGVQLDPFRYDQVPDIALVRVDVDQTQIAGDLGDNRALEARTSDLTWETGVELTLRSAPK